MKSSIKVSLFLLSALVFNTNKSSAQTGPEVCKILYGYDVAGSRIHREYKCEATWTPGDAAPWVGDAAHTTFTSLYPNPTTGIITGVFSESADYAKVTVSTMSGVLVLVQEFTQSPLSTVTVDISIHVPGTYLLTVEAFNKVETYEFIKM